MSYADPDNFQNSDIPTCAYCGEILTRHHAGECGAFLDKKKGAKLPGPWATQKEEQRRALVERTGWPADTPLHVLERVEFSNATMTYAADPTRWIERRNNHLLVAVFGGVLLLISSTSLMFCLGVVGYCVGRAAYFHHRYVKHIADRAARAKR